VRFFHFIADENEYIYIYNGKLLPLLATVDSIFDYPMVHGIIGSVAVEKLYTAFS
jgi:hypothetical protein